MEPAGIGCLLSARDPERNSEEKGAQPGYPPTAARRGRRRASRAPPPPSSGPDGRASPSSFRPESAGIEEAREGKTTGRSSTGSSSAIRSGSSTPLGRAVPCDARRDPCHDLDCLPDGTKPSRRAADAQVRGCLKREHLHARPDEAAALKEGRAGRPERREDPNAPPPPVASRPRSSLDRARALAALARRA